MKHTHKILLCSRTHNTHTQHYSSIAVLHPPTLMQIVHMHKYVHSHVQETLGLTCGILAHMHTQTTPPRCTPPHTLLLVHNDAHTCTHNMRTHTYTHVHTQHAYTHVHTHVYTRKHRHTPPPLYSLSMAGHWARSWYTNVFCQSAGRLTRLLNDGLPLRSILHMLAPLRKVGQVLVNEVYPALQGSSQFPLPSMWSASQNQPLFLAFSGGDQTTATACGPAVLLPVIHKFLQRCQHFSSCPIA